MSETTPEVPVVTSCPYCASERVTTTSDAAVSAATYWRCTACGELWNPGRASVAGRYGSRRW